MSKKNDGGSAMPTGWIIAGTGWLQDGISMRDYFAATVGSADLMAINVQADREKLAGRPQPYMDSGIDGIKFNLEVEAALRYLYADAMLKARK